MNIASGSTLCTTELEACLTCTDTALLLVPPRILRRVIWHFHSQDITALQLLGCQSYIVPRSQFQELVQPAEVPYDPAALPDCLLLLARPNGQDLQGCSPAAILLRYWRILFRNRVKMALLQARTADALAAAELHQRIQQLGWTEWEEICTVLYQEDLLFSPTDRRSTYIQFVALYLELAYFAPQLLSRYFPALADRSDILPALQKEVPAEELFHTSRPRGAPTTPDNLEPVETAATLPPRPERQHSFTQWEYRRKERMARKAARRGNDVRAAIVQMRLACSRDREIAQVAREDARLHLEQLGVRLQKALDLTEQEKEEWLVALVPTLRPAAEGFWTVTARLLYDLQKACLDHERGICAVDLLRWLTSLGRTPLRRELPAHREVMVLRHLRSALRRLPAARLTPRQRERLGRVLGRAVALAAQRCRTWFRPRLEAALTEVDLTAGNLPERVARDKVREEWLDTVVERGVLTMGDLRDALSRNQLKLPDLASVREFIHGDKLLRLNSILTRTLDGVYRPGEIYLRWLQSFNSVAFGTAVGRWLTRCVAVPFGAAYVVLKGSYLIGLEVMHYGFGLETEKQEDPVTTIWSVGLLGLFLLLMLNAAPFRQGVLKLGRWFGRGLHLLLIELPARLPQLPLVQTILTSRAFHFARHYLLKPLALAIVLGTLLRLAQIQGPVNWLISGSAFLLLGLFFRSRLGQWLDEVLSDWIVAAFHHFGLHVAPAVYHYTMDGFKWLVNEIERYLYTVDEWLRFKRSDRRPVLAAKALGSVVWSGFSYLFRVLLVLSIEPSINPIKHFPVVTVAGKLILPLVAAIAAVLQPVLGTWGAGAISTIVLLLLPGVAGFLVWELKENWKLYRANRPRALQPERIGHHGETMLQLLRPGFHSGTVPKQLARWRRAQRRGRVKTMHRAEERLQQVEESVQHFVAREFIHLLHGSRRGRHLGLSIQHIQLAVGRIAVDIQAECFPEQPLRLCFDLKSGWLLAKLGQPGWLAQLPGPEQTLVNFALAGLYKRAGVTFVDERIDRLLAGVQTSHDIRDQQLVVWLTEREGPRLLYDLQAPAAYLAPRVQPAAAQDDWPVLAVQALFFRSTPITWEEWVRHWEQDQSGSAPAPDCGTR